MPAPIPTESTTPGLSVAQRVNRIYEDYMWIARFIVELDADTQLDLKRLFQLYRVHIPKFLELTAGADQTVRDAVVARFNVEGKGWPNIETEFVPLRTALSNFATWLSANFPSADAETTYAELFFLAGTRNVTDRPVVVAKPAALATELANLRVLFG